MMSFDISPKLEKLNSLLSEFNYIPKLALIGKTGVGKSSLCNVLHGSKIAEVNDVEACTREKQRISVCQGHLHVYDFPGIGENQDRDREYASLYNTSLSEMDVIIWLIKSDDRSFSIEETFYEKVVNPIVISNRIPIYFAISQCDKMNPIREWDRNLHKPSQKQLNNLEIKAKEVETTFRLDGSSVQFFSGEENFNVEQVMCKALSSLTPYRYSSSGSSSGWCFITTATCEALGKDDLCEELQTFRYFRDNWLIKQSDGQYLISKYYNVAPLIIEEINKNIHRERIYKSLWYEHLQPAYQAIVTQEFEKAKSIYTLMVKKLWGNYLG